MTVDCIIGCVGTACAGKDTTATAIINMLLHNPTKSTDQKTAAGVLTGASNSLLCFHTPLALEVKKEYVRQHPEVSLQDLLYNPQIKSLHRQGLIDIGDGYRNTIDPLYWLKTTCATIESLICDYPGPKVRCYFVTDMRYENELPYIENYCAERGLCFLSLKILAPLSVIIQRMSETDAKTYLCKHKNNNSERNVKRVHADIDLDNSGTMDALTDQIKAQVLPVLRLMLPVF